MPMLTNIRYLLLTALRDRLFLGLMASILIAGMVSGVLGGTAMVESDRMTLVYAAGSARMILAIGLIVFVCFHVRQAFDSREIDVILSRPMARSGLVLSYWLGFSAAAVLLVVPTAGLVGLLGVMNKAGFCIWSASLLCEALLIVAVALFAALTLKSAVTSVMASLGFYILSRMMGFFVATSHSAILFRSEIANELARRALSGVSMLIPRLDFFAKTEWLVYGPKQMVVRMADGSGLMGDWTLIAAHQEILLFTAQTIAFVPLLLAAAMLDFARRQF